LIDLEILKTGLPYNYFTEDRDKASTTKENYDALELPWESRELKMGISLPIKIWEVRTASRLEARSRLYLKIKEEIRHAFILNR